MRSLPKHPRPRYRPYLFLLEERLPLGDALLGTLVGTSLLGSTRHAGAVRFRPGDV